jgi:branched-chain amino acid transport system substrate-binding protein
MAARELICKEKVTVLFGGLDTPVSVAIVQMANQDKVPFMGSWAAGTPIAKNGGNPNFAFRVSAVDEIVDRGMLAYAQKNFKSVKPGMILVNNPWGESNERGLTAALNAKGMKAAGADTLFLVGNVGPSAQVVKSLDRMGRKVPVVSHWGPAGGRFTELAGPNAKNVHFVQTYSFFGKQSPVGEKVIASLKAKYPAVKDMGDITPTVGVANAYDALNENDYVWAQFIGDEILPVGLAK